MNTAVEKNYISTRRVDHCFIRFLTILKGRLIYEAYIFSSFFGEFCFHPHHSRDFLENLEGDYSTDVALSQHYILTMPRSQVSMLSFLTSAGI